MSEMDDDGTADRRTFAEAVRRQRIALGLTQQQAADRGGVSATTWRMVEVYAQAVSDLSRAAVCRALGWQSDAAPDLLAHAVTADMGKVGHGDLDEPIPCVRLVFHHGHGEAPVHSEKFADVGALPLLIHELVVLHRQFVPDGDHELRMALLPWVQAHFIQRYDEHYPGSAVVSHNEAVEELLAIVRSTSAWSG